MKQKPIKLAAEFDDFSPRNTNFGLLEELRDHFPKFKVTLFLVPWEIRFGEPTPITFEKFRPFCDALIESRDWIEIALHGLTHTTAEFRDLSYEDGKKRIIVAEKMLINREIPYAKIFKAPFWQLSESAKKAAEDLGFTVVEDGYYNWNLKDDMPQKEKVLIGHGHIHLVEHNGLEEVFPKLLNLPLDTKFMFLSEILGTDKIFPAKLNWDPLKEGGENAKT